MLSSLTRNGTGYIHRFVRVFLTILTLFLIGLWSGGSVEARGFDRKHFKSPEEAAASFFAALKNKDAKELSAIFGREGEDLIHSGDPVADEETRQTAVKLFEEGYRIVNDGSRRAILEIGKENWPFPIPVTAVKGEWQFNTKDGIEEILARRIGRNEIGAIRACQAYADAQYEYAAQTQSDGVPEYAQKLFSDPGKKDGLYWEGGDSPIGIFMAKAWQQGYRKGSPEKPAPYRGYYFKIMKAQGKHAPGGAYDYMVKGRMIGGFALVAYPAKYGASGIMTFIVNHAGVVYQKDLGSKTGSIAAKMSLFDPDGSWQKVQ